jgi:hypothetical protein
MKRRKAIKDVTKETEQGRERERERRTKWRIKGMLKIGLRAAEGDEAAVKD